MNDADSFSIDFDAGKGKDAFNCPETLPIDPPVLHVYLASALTNLDDATREESRQIRKLLRDRLERYDYEGVRLQVYDPADVTPPGSVHSDDEVYITDHHQTSTADIVVFYVLAPSLGVGMEAQITADCTLPRVVVTKRGTPLSRMFLGSFSPTIGKIEYETITDFESQLAEQIVAIIRAAIESAQQRRSHIAEFNDDSLGEKIMRVRLVRGITLSDLAIATDVRENWLERLERDPSLAPSVTLIELHRICCVLGTKAAVSASGTPTLHEGESIEQLSAEQKQSLSCLVEFARTREEPVNDQRLLSIWRGYGDQQAEEAEESLRHRRSRDGVITVDEWRKRYEEQSGQLF